MTNPEESRTIRPWVPRALKQRFVQRCRRYEFGAPSQVLRALLTEWVDDLRWTQDPGFARWRDLIREETHRPHRRLASTAPPPATERLSIRLKAPLYARLLARLRHQNLISPTVRHLMQEFLSGALDPNETVLKRETAWGRKARRSTPR